MPLPWQFGYIPGWQSISNAEYLVTSRGIRYAAGYGLLESVPFLAAASAGYGLYEGVRNTISTVRSVTNFA